MRDWDSVRERYMRDDVPRRLGGLAANLARIRSFSLRDTSAAAFESIIDESKRFIEWTALDIGIDTAAVLADLQLQLARWHLDCARIWADPVRRRQVARESGQWSERVLEMSGLLDP